MLLVYPVVTMGAKTHGGSKTNLLGPDPKPELVELFSNEKQVTDRTPPTFLTHAKTDAVVLLYHMKPAFFDVLKAQVAELNDPRLIQFGLRHGARFGYRQLDRGGIQLRLRCAGLRRAGLFGLVAGGAINPADSPSRRILEPLNQKRLLRFNRGDKVGQPSGRHFELPGMVLRSLTQFGGCDHHLSF